MEAFLTVYNLWREDETIKELIFSKRIGKIAADLMQVNGVRMYHDQALFKKPAAELHHGMRSILLALEPINNYRVDSIAEPA